MDPSPPVLRARELLRAHAHQDLPDLGRLSGENAAPTSADRLRDPVFAALLEAAFLVAAADGELKAEEIGSLADLTAQVTGDRLGQAELSAMFAAFEKHLEAEGRTGRVTAMAAALTDPVSRREVLGFAVLVALCDHDLAPSELFVLHAIGQAFGIPNGDVNDVIRSMQLALGRAAR